MKRRWKPDRVVCIGDILDQYSLSRYTKAVESVNAAEELHASESMIRELAKLFPSMSVCLGNHDLRYLKKAVEAGIPGVYLKSFGDIIQAPAGWTFDHSFTFDGIEYFHGDGFTGLSAGPTAIKTKFRSCVFGHTHQASITYVNGLWAMNVGCLIDASSYAFQYAQNTRNRPTLGVGIVESGVPHFIPFH